MRVTAIHTYPVKGCYRVDHEVAEVEPWGLVGDRRWLIVDPDGGAITQREAPMLTQLRPQFSGADGALVMRTKGMADLVVPQPVDGDPVDVQVFAFRGWARGAGASADEWLSEVLRRPVRLVWLDDPGTRRPVDPEFGQPGDTVSFADGYPLLVANAASLDALNDWIAAAGQTQAREWPLPMTRFRPNLVVGGAPAWAEDAWIGRRLRVGSVTLRVAKVCGRCVVTTTDQETGERGSEPLSTLARHHQIGQKLVFGVNLIPDGRGSISIDDPVSLV